MPHPGLRFPNVIAYRAAEIVICARIWWPPLLSPPPPTVRQSAADKRSLQCHGLRGRPHGWRKPARPAGRLLGPSVKLAAPKFKSWGVIACQISYSRAKYSEATASRSASGSIGSSIHLHPLPPNASPFSFHLFILPRRARPTLMPPPPPLAAAARRPPWDQKSEAATRARRRRRRPSMRSRPRLLPPLLRANANAALSDPVGSFPAISDLSVFCW